MPGERNGNTGPRILVAAFGGGGGRILQRLDTAGWDDRVQRVWFDSDASCEDFGGAGIEGRRLGAAILRGLGCGGDVEKGRAAAQHDRRLLAEMAKAFDLVILVGCLGRGLASGALPEAASVMAEQGLTTLAFVCLPFDLEGQAATKRAREAVRRLREGCHVVVEMPNDLLLQSGGADDRIDRLFSLSDEWVSRGVGSVVGMVLSPGLISLDLSSLREALGDQGNRTFFSVAECESDATSEEVFDALSLCPLFGHAGHSIRGERLLLAVGVGPDTLTRDFAGLLRVVRDHLAPDGDLRLGLYVRDELAGKVRVALFASTNLEKGRPAARPATGSSQPVAVHRPGRRKAREPEEAVATPAQGVFAGLFEEQDRGVFAVGEEELYRGKDLDKPTFLRRGIRINV